MADGSWFLEQHRLIAARYADRIGRAAAEDLASEAIARCLRHPPPDGKYGPWLERIGRNLLVDHFRRARPGRSEAPLPPDELPADDQPACPEELLLRAERRSWLASAWPRVRPDLREVLEARFYQERADADIAAERGLSPTTIRTRVSRGLARLRRTLAKVASFIPVVPSPGAQGLALALVPAAMTAIALAPAPVVPLQVAVPLAQAAPAAQVEPLRRPRAAPVGPPARATPARPRPPGPQPAPPAPPAPPRPVARYDFAPDDVEGDLQRPDEVVVIGPARAPKKPSLIEIPSSFLTAIAKSLEEM